MLPISVSRHAASVPDRAAVIHHAHHEPGIDVALHLRAEPVGVEPGGAAVHQHDHRERPIAFGRDVEPVHAVAFAVVEVPRHVRPALGGALTVGAQHLGALVVQHQGLTVALGLPEPHPAVGTDPGAPDRARRVVDRRQRPGGEVVPVHLVTAFEEVDQEQRRRVGPPVVDLDHARAGRSRDRSALPSRGPRWRVAHRRSVRAGSRAAGRPAIGDQHEDLQGEPLVELLGDHGARSRVDHAKGGVDQVAVFGVFEASTGFRPRTARRG